LNYLTHFYFSKRKRNSLILKVQKVDLPQILLKAGSLLLRGFAACPAELRGALFFFLIAKAQSRKGIGDCSV
jgi:hypothetical protein